MAYKALPHLPLSYLTPNILPLLSVLQPPWPLGSALVPTSLQSCVLCICCYFWSGKAPPLSLLSLQALAPVIPSQGQVLLSHVQQDPKSLLQSTYLSLWHILMFCIWHLLMSASPISSIRNGTMSISSHCCTVSTVHDTSGRSWVAGEKQMTKGDIWVRPWRITLPGSTESKIPPENSGTGVPAQYIVPGLS